MGLIKDDKAVSEIVGTVLLLAIAICIFSLLSVIVMSYPIPSDTPSANLVGTIIKTNEGEYSLVIEHRGGTSLRLDTKVLLEFSNGTSKSIRIGEKQYLDTNAKEDNLWGIGECFIYTDSNLKNQNVTISIVDVESNSMIMTGLLQVI